ncbi:hypothetical protein, partial [Brucella melitensis]|uniref:hypothetical protein n=1 Tax=Brucella melitensis TaxID=29459 RepID=UPI001AEE8D51
ALYVWLEATLAASKILVCRNKLLREADRRRNEPTDLLHNQFTGPLKAHLMIDSKPSHDNLQPAMPAVLFFATSLFERASICRLCL